MSMLIDTHCHLDAAEFDADRSRVAADAAKAGVEIVVVPAVERANFSAVETLCATLPGCAPAYGIHPLYVDRAQEADLAALEQQLRSRPAVAVGEIGLDFFVDGHDADRQTWFFVEQLKLARELGLPVLLHLRKAGDQILKQLRLIRVCGGVAHAFNGSRQQAEAFIGLGFKLGFGGAMTWPRATHLRALAASLPLEAIVLETDAPDIPPHWLGRDGRNAPGELPDIAVVLAGLRGMPLSEVLEITTMNALQAMPKLAGYAHQLK